MSESESVRPDQKGFRAAWADVEQFVPRIHEYQRSCLVDGKPLFETGSPIVVARAPGRLDVMGGIADYSGSLVLQWPIREATLVAVQAVRRARPEDRQPGAGGRSRTTHSRSRRARARSICSKATTTRPGVWFSRDPALHWAAYVVGVLVVLERERDLQLGCWSSSPGRVPRARGQGRELVGGA